MRNLTNYLKKTFGAGLIGIALISSGCSRFNLNQDNIFHRIEDLPSSYVAQSTNQLLNDKELIEKFYELFPDKKPELSYQMAFGKYKSKIFFHPDINLSRNSYEFLSGLEVRY